MGAEVGVADVLEARLAALVERVRARLRVGGAQTGVGVVGDRGRLARPHAAAVVGDGDRRAPALALPLPAPDRHEHCGRGESCDDGAVGERLEEVELQRAAQLPRLAVVLGARHVQRRLPLRVAAADPQAAERHQQRAVGEPPQRDLRQRRLLVVGRLDDDRRLAPGAAAVARAHDADLAARHPVGHGGEADEQAVGGLRHAREHRGRCCRARRSGASPPLHCLRHLSISVNKIACSTTCASLRGAVRFSLQGGASFQFCSSSLSSGSPLAQLARAQLGEHARERLPRRSAPALSTCATTPPWVNICGGSQSASTKASSHAPRAPIARTEPRERRARAVEPAQQRGRVVVVVAVRRRRRRLTRDRRDPHLQRDHQAPRHRRRVGLLALQARRRRSRAAARVAPAAPARACAAAVSSSRVRAR